MKEQKEASCPRKEGAESLPSHVEQTGEHGTFGRQVSAQPLQGPTSARLNGLNFPAFSACLQCLHRKENKAKKVFVACLFGVAFEIREGQKGP